jgi:nitrite reductase/ring-hydroxylating ferredoxin subunit/uncharacterized membrane protein
MAMRSSDPFPGVDPGAQAPRTTSVEEKLQKAVDKALYSGGSPTAQKVRNFLNGTWIGEPLHVILTDIPIGAWTVGLVFDGLDLIAERREFAVAADASLAFGLAGAAAAAVAGIVDWSDVDPPPRRVGLIHGTLNLTSAALFATSLILRKKKSRKQGRLLSALGYGVMTLAAHLGGKMVYEYRVGVDRTSGQVFPEEFAAVMPETGLEESKPTRAEYHGTPIVLVRKGERIFALAETCSHFGGPLSQGKLIGNSIVCPYHGSRFALNDGRVINGPAVHPQPCLEARIQNGNVEVRRSGCEEGGDRLGRQRRREHAGAD